MTRRKAKQSKIKCLFGQNKLLLWDIKKWLQIWLTGSLSQQVIIYKDSLAVKFSKLYRKIKRIREAWAKFDVLTGTERKEDLL